MSFAGIQAQARSKSQGPMVIDVPVGFYVLGVTTADDPDQTDASKLALEWLDTHQDYYTVVQTDAGGFARIASIHVDKPVSDYPLDGALLYRTTEQGAQNPKAVWDEGNTTNTAQQLALDKARSQKTDAANAAGQSAGGLAGAAAGGAAEALRNSTAPTWLWFGMGIAGVFAVASLVRSVKG